MELISSKIIPNLQFYPVMPKLTLLFFLFFSTATWSQTKENDTISRMPDCTRYHEEQRLYLKKLTSEAAAIDYSGLSRKIVENIVRDCIPSKDLIVFLENKVDLICLEGILNDCMDMAYGENPNYKDADFWNPGTFRYLNRFLDKNIIPKKSRLGDGYKTFYINQKATYKGRPGAETKTSKNAEAYHYILSWDTEKDLNKDYHVLRNRGKTAVNLATANSIALSFRNFADRKVEVTIGYNQRKLIQTIQILTFQYNHTQWEQVSGEFRDE